MSSMRNVSEIRHAVRKLERHMPYLLTELDPGRLSSTMHRNYELLMTDTPGKMQDEVHDALRKLMVRAGVTSKHLR